MTGTSLVMVVGCLFLLNNSARWKILQTWFENTIHKRPLYSGSAYVFTVRTSCENNSVEYAVYNPLGHPKYFTDFMEAMEYYLSLGN